MLELKPECERCGAELPPHSRQATICSFECTFCRSCAETALDHSCPNCSGELVRRPTRLGRVARGLTEATVEGLDP